MFIAVIMCKLMVLSNVHARNNFHAIFGKIFCWSHGVTVVVDLADKARTLSENFEGFSQILEEQIGDKRY